MDKTNANIFEKTNQEQSDKMNSYITELLLEKMKLVEEEKYVEAELIKRKIKEVKESQEDKSKQSIYYQHENEMKALEEEYNKEIIEFHNKWDEQYREFIEQEDKEENYLNETHDREMKVLIEYLENTLSKQMYVKHTREYLNLREIQSKMVKQERYLEADQVKAKADLMRKNEEKKFNVEKELKIKAKVDKLIKKQQTEKNVLKVKFEKELEILKKNKNEELEKLVLLFKNKKFDLEAQQKIEKIVNENTNLMRAKTYSKFSREKNQSAVHKNKKSLIAFQAQYKNKEMRKNNNSSKSYQNTATNYETGNESEKNKYSSLNTYKTEERVVTN